MLIINVEGVYESDVGTNQKKYTEFNYTFKTSRLSEKGVDSHIAKRFIPMLVANDKSKKTIFSRLRSFNIISIKETDDKDSIIGKNIDELNDWQIQDLACTFDLYEVPLWGKHTFTVIKEKATSAYLKKVWNIDLNEKNPDGTLKYDLDKVGVEIPAGYFDKKEKQIRKQKVSDVIKKTVRAIANGVLSVTDNTTEQNNVPAHGLPPSGFPTADELNKE
ncbi:MAG: hypothetical protein LUB59_04670 [Candidatus Gastranaerophilales bacterium]|nr:hypothetical protein [Candidatus Gastranaerophilales bacterium]